MKVCDVPLTEAEIRALIQLLGQAISTGGSTAKVRGYRRILEKLDHAQPTER